MKLDCIITRHLLVPLLAKITTMKKDQYMKLFKVPLPDEMTEYVDLVILELHRIRFD